MSQDNKLTLSTADVQSVQKIYDGAVGELLEDGKPRKNLIGLGVGVKWVNGQPTGEPALIALVTNKVDKSLVSKADLVPPKLQDLQTDVLAIGYPTAGGLMPLDTAVQSLTTRVRPAKGGYSVGHYKITAGTISTRAYDILPGGSTSTPTHGVGIPNKYYILSNNHVLANSNTGVVGDPILQPGPFDGGVDPTDRIATLTRFVPIKMSPAIPLEQHDNVVDCAVAETNFYDLDGEIYWNGFVRGWRRRADVLTMVGQTVKKTGRTTNFTTGRITVVNATVDVSYGSGRVARMRDQIVTTNMSAGGDSGSLVMTLDNVAVGLLFAGSSVAMIANQIENVRNLLRIEVAEQIL